jgi:hypothetical protein
MTNIWVKSTIILSVLAKKKFLYLFKNKNLYFYDICGLVAPPLLVLLLDPGSEMDKNQDPGYTSRIRNTVHKMITSVGTVQG